ncbi:hypothetical protein [Desulfatitalea alkaliphila]|uniref:Uncharacterized protein n=1 Tax=Desulfatitalea alkaliphila TaxID=2929485 RepID=A0AA41R4K8_9BACT|nr:hypothetical protein [Desulfatitalea alkaliphila]MCJ8502254.1 hypothetical protein [Desulfatitalea alkaliphila]
MYADPVQTRRRTVVGRHLAIPAAVLLWGLLWGWPAPAWAIQSHGGPEGLHAHQMAHLFFGFSMGLLIYWLRKRRLVTEQGWRFIQYGALFFIAWNLNAFFGHWLEEASGLLVTERVGPMHIRITTSEGYGWLGVVFYLVKLDHLLCVPALVCLYLGLRRLLRDADQRRQAETGA